MNKWSEQVSFNQSVVDWSVIGFFERPITLKSGRESYWYVNWRSVAEDVYRLDKVTDYVLHFVHFLMDSGALEGVDTIFGVPEGASKYALLSQYKMARDSDYYSEGSHVMAFGRGKRKEHGEMKDRYLLGVPKGKTIVLEDVTTTGGSLFKTVDLLEECGVNVTGAIALTNREEGGQSISEILADRVTPIPYFAMSRGIEVLPLALDKAKEQGKGVAPGAEEELKKLVLV